MAGDQTAGFKQKIYLFYRDHGFSSEMCCVKAAQLLSPHIATTAAGHEKSHTSQLSVLHEANVAAVAARLLAVLSRSD